MPSSSREASTPRSISDAVRPSTGHINEAPTSLITSASRESSVSVSSSISLALLASVERLPSDASRISLAESASSGSAVSVSSSASLVERLSVSKPVPPPPKLSLALFASMYRLPSDRKSTRLNSSHQIISYAVFCLTQKHHHNHT